MIKNTNYRNIELFSQEDEKIVLAVLLQDSGFIVNLDKWELKPETFYFKEHRTIFSAIMAIFNEKGSVDVHVVGNRLKTWGLSKFNDLDIFEYLTEVLIQVPISKDHYSTYLENLCRWYFLRQADTKFKEGRRKLRDNRDKPIAEIQSMVEQISADASTVKVSNLDDGFTDLFGTIEDNIKKIAESGEIPGLWSPFKTFNDHFGPMTFGDAFLFAAKSKVGKSTILAFLTKFFAQSGKGKTHCVLIDTEMEDWRVQTRIMSSETGIKEFYFRNGGFSKDATMISKSEDAFQNLKKLKGLVHHIYAADKPIDEIVALVKRYHAKHIKEEDSLVVINDYLKTTGETSEDMKEWQLIGEKCNAFKKLASALPRTVTITSIQLNEEDNVAMSSRVKWFASAVFLLKKKTPDQLSLHGLEYGSHFLEMLVTRSQGEFFDEYVTVAQGSETKFLKNNINLDFSNFSIQDKGDYKKMIKELTTKGKQLVLNKPKEGKEKRDYSSFF